MTAKVRHLLVRNGRFYARLSVPEALRSKIGKKEFTEALGADRRTALDRLPAAVARMKSAIKEAGPSPVRAPRPGQKLTPGQLAARHYESELELDERARDHVPAPVIIPITPGDLESRLVEIDEDKWVLRPDPNSEAFEAMMAHKPYALRQARPADFSAARAAHAEALRRVVAGTAENDEIKATIGWAVAAFIESGNSAVTPGSEEWRSLARNLAAVQLETIQRMNERDQGDFSGQPKLPILNKQDTPSDPRYLKEDSALSLRELLPRYLAKAEFGDSTKNEHDVSVRMFEEVLGPKPLYRITRADIESYKDTLLEAPAHYIKRFPTMTLPEAIEANKKRAVPYSTLQPITVDVKWLSTLSTMFNWAVRIGLIPDNPANGIKVMTKADHKRKRANPSRVNFDPSDLVKIFSGPLFDKKKKWGESQWAYLCSLFGGMRPTELAQVKLDSIWHEQGVLIMSIQEEVKTGESRRLIPIHAKLIKLGFEPYVANLRKAGETHLFPQWYADGQEALAKAQQKAKVSGKPLTLNHYFPRIIPRTFNESYKQIVHINDPRKNFYSFRHTFKSGLSRAGVTRDLSDLLTGHADSSAGGAYIHKRGSEPVREMKKAVDKLRFDGFPL